MTVPITEVAIRQIARAICSSSRLSSLLARKFVQPICLVPDLVSLALPVSDHRRSFGASVHRWRSLQLRQFDEVAMCMLPYPPRTPEGEARSGMKFVKVATVDGHLTDISIAMILVELKRLGVRLSLEPITS